MRISSATRGLLLGLLAAALLAAAGCGGEAEADKKRAATTVTAAAPAATREATRMQENSGQQASGNAPGVPELTGEVQRQPSGLGYIDEQVGEGATPARGQRVTVHYTGWLTTGQKFDSSRDSGRPFTFTLGAGEVIRGWDEGVATMKIGGKRRLVLPPTLGYGARGAPPVIPGNATLLFDVELISAQ